MIITPFYSFTRPADTTQYAALDLVANSATAADVVPLSWSMKRLGGSGLLRGVRFYKSAASATAAVFNLHLYSATPGVPTNGDNGAFGIISAANNIGLVTVDMTTGGSAGTAGLFKRVGGVDICIDFANVNGVVFGLLTTGTAGTYTPADAETFRITLELDSNR
jgi:hypothetical protein